MKKKIFITGGAGYVGSRLVPQLLEKFIVTVYDIMYFGSDFLPSDNPDLTIIEGDIRNTQDIVKYSKGHNYFLNLACISNDTSFELDENLSTTINLDAFEPMVIAAKNNNIERFIYASTSSVYGVSNKKNVTEEHELVPLTLYNKYKGMCGPLLLKHTDDNFTGVIFRPATVCGYAPRLRLDLSVNILTNHAIINKEIKVFGGGQLRPNLHIQDYCDAVKLFIDVDKNLVQNQIFNVGYQNLSIKEIALMVQKVVKKEMNYQEIKISYSSSDDQRSYHINSDKIYNILNFKPKFSIEDAIKELCQQFKDKNIRNSMDDDLYYNVKRIKKLNQS